MNTVRRLIVLAALGLAIAAGSACRPADVMPGPVCTVTVVDGHAVDVCQ